MENQQDLSIPEMLTDFWEGDFSCTDTEHSHPKPHFSKTPWTLFRFPPEKVL